MLTVALSRLPHGLICATLALALFLAPATGQEIDLSGPTLTVSAEGRAEAVPDMASITLVVSREEERAVDALAAMSEGLADVLETIGAAGIEARDLQTQALTLKPIRRRYEGLPDTPPEIIGYLAASPVMVRVRDLDDLGRVIDAVVSSGANELRGLSFGLSAPGPVMDEARRTAVAEARRRAVLYAEAAGVTLGPLLSLLEGGTSTPRPMMRGDMALSEAASVPIAEGELTLEARVTMTYAIVAAQE